MEREHEAHQALGDVASLMGVHDVAAEEDTIRQVLAGRRNLDEVVRTPQEVVDGDDFDAFFWKIAAEDPDAPPSAEEASMTLAPEWRGTGLYPDTLTFLDEALLEAFAKPANSVDAGGVAWRRHDDYGIAELVPPSDLMQRLEVLPQDYLSERRVSSLLKLATNRERGEQQLAAAWTIKATAPGPKPLSGPAAPRSGMGKRSSACALGRNQVFAVRGQVAEPSLLLLGTLTNRRGQVVAASWMTAVGHKSTAFIEPHESASAALQALGVTSNGVNRGAVDGLERIQKIIAPAVHAARGHMELTFAAADQSVADRVEIWSKRLRIWEDEADVMTQRPELRQRRISIQHEQELVLSMKPAQQLVRPLLVVVPADWETA